LVIEQLFKDLAVVDAGGRGAEGEDELGFQVGFQRCLIDLFSHERKKHPRK
jgi:hypothetical protein